MVGPATVCIGYKLGSVRGGVHMGHFMVVIFSFDMVQTTYMQILHKNFFSI